MDLYFVPSTAITWRVYICGWKCEPALRLLNSQKNTTFIARHWALRLVNVSPLVILGKSHMYSKEFTVSTVGFGPPQPATELYANDYANDYAWINTDLHLHLIMTCHLLDPSPAAPTLDGRQRWRHWFRCWIPMWELPRSLGMSHGGTMVKLHVGWTSQ